jgi:4-amino-4-deoxy-L-arabinose transferase-like glycosyltransferase
MSDAGHSDRRLHDLLWLGGLALLFIATGIGLRDPWPADEPRFALVARDMVMSGDWMFPRVGGDLYSDKPPLFFWLLAIGYWITGSIRYSFLIPSFLAACATLYLVYDMAMRLAGRAAGFATATLLACTVQFVMVMRGAQIDPVLCFLTTLSLYAFMRHLLFGPAWGWYLVAGFAAGLGVITKGVGFLPLLIVLPYVLLRARGFTPLPRFTGGARWTLALIGFLAGIAVWLIPMLSTVAASGDAAHVAYRDGILFHQTVHRYASAWHHKEPWHYFLIQVIPPLWLPGSLLLFWLIPLWKRAWSDRDARAWLPLAWMLLVVVFFSLSTGKRGVYLLPALPAFVIAASPWLVELFAKRAVRYLGLALAALIVVLAAGAVVYDFARHDAMSARAAELGTDPRFALRVLAATALIAWVICWRKRPLLAWPAMLACLVLVWSYIVNPEIDARRSGKAFMQRALAQVPAGRELALAGAKEQFYLYLDRPVINFGHARWQERPAEAADAARWLNAAPGRVILMPESLISPCFQHAPRRLAGITSQERWSLVEVPADAGCARRGDPERAIRYTPTFLSRIRTSS